MNTFQICKNTLDAVPLYLPLQLFLKPVARLNISLQLPQKTMGKSISNWEVMESLRSMIKPEKYIILKVTKTNVEFIRFEAEIDDKSKLELIIGKLDNKTIKLRDFPELLKLRASVAKTNFPSRNDWDVFFRDSKDMNEMRPGERPDTIHISNLPIKWFVPRHLTHEDNVKPSEKVFYRVFEKFGPLRQVDIPICDPYRNKMKSEVSGMQVFDFKEEHFFEGYVQFKDYIGFTKAMDAFRDKKLLNKSDNEVYTVNITVDFDRTKHLSDASVRRRDIVRNRLVKREVDREEKERNKLLEEENELKAERQKEIDKKNAKEQRRQQREEKRKKKILEKLKVKGAHAINEKIAKEEKKLLKVQRKLEAIRLVEELFKRVKNSKEKDSTLRNSNNVDELTKFKNSSELQVREQREKLHRIIEGRVVLKSILGGAPRTYHYDDSSSSDEKTKLSKGIVEEKVQYNNGPNVPVPLPIGVGDWYGYPYQVPNMYSLPLPSFPYLHRGNRGLPSTSRGFVNYHRNPRQQRFRGSYRKHYGLPPEMQDEYYKYFEKFKHEHDNRNEHSRNSRSPSYSRHRYKSRHRTPSRSRSRSRKSYARSRSRSRRRSRSYSRKRSRSHSRRSRSRSARHADNTPSKHDSRRKSRSRSRRQNSKSPSYKSIDSSKFISPSRLRISRSKSWSLPNDGEKSAGKRSWSKSPSVKK